MNNQLNHNQFSNLSFPLSENAQSRRGQGLTLNDDIVRVCNYYNADGSELHVALLESGNRVLTSRDGITWSVHTAEFCFT